MPAPPPAPWLENPPSMASMPSKRSGLSFTNCRRPIDMRSSSPSAVTIRLTGNLPATALIDISAFHWVMCGPFVLVAPRATMTLGNGGCSTSRASKGGTFQRSGCVIGIVSYIQ